MIWSEGDLRRFLSFLERQLFCLRASLRTPVASLFVLRECHVEPQISPEMMLDFESRITTLGWRLRFIFTNIKDSTKSNLVGKCAHGYD